jgi:hypothetical protein
MGILDKTIGTAAGTVRLGMRLAGGVLGRLPGVGGGEAPEAPAGPPNDLGDAQLADEVRTAIFRGMRAAETRAIDVDVVDGAVHLRGRARNEQQIRTLEARARAIPEVRDVQVLLDLPEPPPDEIELAAAQAAARNGA